MDQRVAGLIVPNHSHGSDVSAESRHVVCGIGATARQYLPLALFQDEHRRFARNPNDFAVDGLIGDKVSQHNDSLAREALHQSQQRNAIRRWCLHNFRSITAAADGTVLTNATSFRPPRRSARHPSSSEEGSQQGIPLLIQEAWRAERRGGYSKQGRHRPLSRTAPPVLFPAAHYYGE